MFGAGLARHEHDDVQLTVGDVPLEQVDRDRDVRRHQLRRGAGADDQPGEAGAAQPRLGPAGEPQQCGVDLHDPVGTVQDEGGRRGGERKIGAHPGGSARSDGAEPGVGGAAPVEEVAAGHRPDSRRCLGGRRRGALDDAQRGVPRDAEHAGPRRGAGAQARSAGGRDLDGRLVAVASGDEGEGRGGGCGRGAVVDRWGRAGEDGRAGRGGRKAGGERVARGGVHGRARAGNMRHGRAGQMGRSRAGQMGRGRGVGDYVAQPGREQGGVRMGLDAVPRLLCTLQVHPRDRIERLRPVGVVRRGAVRLGPVRVGAVHVRAAVLGHGHLPGWWCRPSLA